MERDDQTVLVAVSEALSLALSRITRDDEGLPVKLHPFTRYVAQDAPKMVEIDPEISFGRPVIAGTGLATQVIAERYKCGESIDDLADDYGCTNAEIEEAIRYEVSNDSA